MTRQHRATTYRLLQTTYLVFRVYAKVFAGQELFGADHFLWHVAKLLFLADSDEIAPDIVEAGVLQQQAVMVVGEPGSQTATVAKQAEDISIMS